MTTACPRRGDWVLDYDTILWAFGVSHEDRVKDRLRPAALRAVGDAGVESEEFWHGLSVAAADVVLYDLVEHAKYRGTDFLHLMAVTHSARNYWLPDYRTLLWAFHVAHGQRMLSMICQSIRNEAAGIDTESEEFWRGASEAAIECILSSLMAEVRGLKGWPEGQSINARTAFMSAR